MSLGDVGVSLTYDLAGRLETRTDTIDGKTWTSRVDYDNRDNVSMLTYPSGRRVSYTYDTQDRLGRVYNEDTNATYASNFAYHASGAVNAYTAGNGVVTALGYNSDRLWLNTVLVGTGDNRLQLQYQHDAAGNVKKILDWRHGFSQEFAYDPVDRLQSFGHIGTASTSFTYDVHGNRLTAGGLSYEYHASKPFHLKSIGGAHNLTWDSNGNLRSGFPGQYDYTPRNLLARSIKSGTTTDYHYDAELWRVKKVTQAWHRATSTAGRVDSS